jgi:hypothetical protein
MSARIIVDRFPGLMSLFAFVFALVELSATSFSPHTKRDLNWLRESIPVGPWFDVHSLSV